MAAPVAASASESSARSGSGALLSNARTRLNPDSNISVTFERSAGPECFAGQEDGRALDRGEGVRDVVEARPRPVRSEPFPHLGRGRVEVEVEVEVEPP